MKHIQTSKPFEQKILSYSKHEQNYEKSNITILLDSENEYGRCQRSEDEF